MERTAESISVEREIEIAASPETVWEFLVDSEKATRWMGVAASLDPRPGGLYRVEIVPGNTARGEFVELDAPRRLVFSWGWEPSGDSPSPVPPGSTTIEVELVPVGEGTLLRLRHCNLPTTDSARSHARGWDHYLERLTIAAPGGDPGRDSWLD
ncbi:MAG: SRPBCC family protein [Gaiellaceae bacterium]